MLTTRPMPKLYDEQFLSECRLLGDPEADDVIGALFVKDGGRGMREVMQGLSANRDLSGQGLPAELAAFYQCHAVLPAWANSRTMRAGASFFRQYGGAIMSLLGALSLPYCYAGANGAQVLYLSKRIYEDTPRRLLETGQFVLDVMAHDAFDTGAGFASVLNVRLMHAAVRHHILTSGRWDIAWGHPINQEDMAGTILAFSHICIRGLRKAGYLLNQAEIDAFQHLWNVVGHMMGVRSELLPETASQAQHLDARIRQRQFRPSEAGRTLTKALLDTMSQSPQEGLPKDFVRAYSRFLLGEEISEMLGVPKIGDTRRFLQLLQVRNLFGSLLPNRPDAQLGQIRRMIAKGQAQDMVRFAVPLSLRID